MWRPVSVCVMAVLAVCPRADARQAAPAPSGPPIAEATAARTGISIGWEFRHDTHRYRFENPSSFNTAALVPHHFEQTFRVSSHWVVAAVSYRLAGRVWLTEAGWAPPATGFGDDYDTFFNPDGNVIVYGTAVRARIGSFRFRHWIELARLGRLDVQVGYAWRRDESRYPPGFSTTTQTAPPSSSAVWNEGRETTLSNTHEVRFGLSGAWRIGQRWGLVPRLDVTPVGSARLTTLLPDKYPGQPIVFTATAGTLAPSLAVRGDIGRCTLTIVVDYVHSWSYQAARQFSQSGGGIRAQVRF